MRISSSSSSGHKHDKNEFSRRLTPPKSGRGSTLAKDLGVLAGQEMDKANLKLVNNRLQETTLWIQALIDNMETMADMSEEQLDEIAQLKATAKAATKDFQASRGTLRKTSVLAASVMYWLSFGPGKIVTNTVSGSLVAAGFPMAATYAPWINALGVPFIQVAFAEPFGGAYRGDGQSYQSPDGVAYANYQTALALMCRAWLEGNQDDIDKYNAILGKIVDSVIDREQKAQQARGKPLYWTSGKDKPERDKKGLAKDPSDDPAFWVMWYARWRSFLSDEVPIHTFSFLNGISGAASMAWPTLMGPALARIPDAGAHVILGTLAMIWMFEAQNTWRRELQHASLGHGSDKEVLALKRAAPNRQLEIWTTRMTQLAKYDKGIEALRSSLLELRRTLPEGDERLDRIVTCLDELDGVQRELHQRMKTVYKFTKKARREADAWKSVKERAEATAKGSMNAYLGEPNKQPVPWLDGSPLVVRNVAKLFGYMAVLAPSAVQAMMLAQMLLVPNTPGANQTASLPNAWNDTMTSGHTASTGLHDLSALAWVMASSVALNAIVGWTGRTLYGVPAFEFLIHGTLGAAKGVAQKAASCVRAARGQPGHDTVIVVPIAKGTGGASSRESHVSQGTHSVAIEMPDPPIDHTSTSGSAGKRPALSTFDNWNQRADDSSGPDSDSDMDFDFDAGSGSHSG